MMPEWNKLKQLLNEVISYEEQMNKLQDEKNLLKWIYNNEVYQLIK